MIAKRITATAISAIRITASRISAAISDKLCRYFFTFNGDGYITTDRRWNPDAIDPSFVMEFYQDTSVVPTSVIWSQSDQNLIADIELRLDLLSSGSLRLYKGGNTTNLLSGSGGNPHPDLGLGIWRIEYNNNTLENKVYKDDILLNTIVGNIGIARNPQATTLLMDRPSLGNGDEGVMANVKFWINSDKKETGDLVLDMPINDNSNTIKDYSPLALDGVLTAGTGTWDEACEGDLTFNGQPLTFNGENLTF